MEHLFADRIKSVPRSFIREILKVSLDPGMISFAGGLPNKEYFPVAAVARAAAQILSELGAEPLQYSASEGLLPLRQAIADRYRKRYALNIRPESILITNGSQQGLDLLGKVLLNEGDAMLIEEPGYLGAIQSMSVYRPEFVPVPMTDQGLDTGALRQLAGNRNAKCLYLVPNFQNPSGATYSSDSRREVAEIAAEQGFLIIEDDPYGELRFRGSHLAPIFSYLPEQTILLGSFSKTVAPGFRLGWLVAPEQVYEKLLVAKQAADLHSSSINQYIISRYLQDNDLDAHLQTIAVAYSRQCEVMLAEARRNLPPEIQLQEPDGGMFLWGTLPEGLDAMTLFKYAVAEKVVFVPGDPFYTSPGTVASFRLSFATSDGPTIQEGMRRFGRAVSCYLKDQQ